MHLTKVLRNHKLLQVWSIRGNDSLQLYADELDDIFENKDRINSNPVPSLVLPIDSTSSNVYNFNLGINVVNRLLKGLKLGKLKAVSDSKKERKVNISFDQSESLIIPQFEIDKYLDKADVKEDSVMKHLNKNKLILISGLIRAKKIIVEIETTTESANDLEAEINEGIGGNIRFNVSSEKKIKMEHEGDYFPIAVKAHRIDFDKNIFSKTILVTDSDINRIDF